MVTHMINIFALFPFSLLFFYFLFLFFFFFIWLPIAQICIIYYKHGGDRRGRDRMVDGIYHVSNHHEINAIFFKAVIYLKR
jgi:hypothetical protein